MGYEKLAAGGDSLPLGLAGSGLLLSVFTLIKSSISLQLVEARGGSKNGFPFVFETVLIFPFTMQSIFYTCQTCTNLGFRKGLESMKEAASSMGPCLFYAGFIVSTTVLETYSLQFIRPSTFVVLKQLTMVVIALGEVVMLSARPSRTAWFLVFAQVCCVALFQFSSCFPETHHVPSVILGGTPSHHKGPMVLPVRVLGMNNWTAGMSACLASVFTGGIGSILQQRFIQRQATTVPPSIKLFYQHAIELFWVILLLISQERAHLWQNGFFGGWNHWTALVSLTMWFAFLSGSAISANISAIAGAFAIAVSVAFTGILEFALLGRSFSRHQFALMGMVCVIAMLYTRERVAMLSKEDPEQKALLQKHLRFDHEEMS
jgi:hypothetical protein